MRIMCLNAWGGRLSKQLLPYLKEENPDVLCLQEVVRTPGCDDEWLDYRDLETVLPQRANLFDEVAAALPDHTSIFCPAAQGPLWRGDVEISSQWGLATYVRSSIPIVGQVQGFIHREFLTNGYGDHPRSRNAHGIRLFDFSSQRMLAIVHLHGLRDLSGKADSPARADQARRVMSLVTSVAAGTDAIVVCGDFNVLPNSKTHDALRGIGLRELVTGGGYSGTRTSLYEKAERFADYMFVNDAVQVEKFEVVSTPEVSDHCPLVLTISGNQINNRH